MGTELSEILLQKRSAFTFKTEVHGEDLVYEVLVCVQVVLKNQ